MAAPKIGTDGYNRLKAHRYRKKVEAGQATEEQKAWLAEYEAVKSGNRVSWSQPRNTIGSVPPHVTTQRVETNPIEAQATEVPQTAPPPMEVPPLGSATSAAAGSNGGDSSTEGATPASSSPASQKEAAVTAIVDMAATAWKTGMDKLAQMAGVTERMFPDEFVDKIWKPAAIRLGVKYMPDSVGSDLADAVVVIGPPAATVFAARRAAAQLKAKEESTGEIAAKPAGMPTVSTPPSEQDAPHAATPPTSNGVLMNKTDIRRAKLAPNQIPEVF